MLNAYAREPLINKGLLGVKIHYIIALLTNDIKLSIFIDVLCNFYTHFQHFIENSCAFYLMFTTT